MRVQVADPLDTHSLRGHCDRCLFLFGEYLLGTERLDDLGGYALGIQVSKADGGKEVINIIIIEEGCNFLVSYITCKIQALEFTPELLPKLAKVLKAARRRKCSDAEKKRLAAGRAHRFQRASDGAQVRLGQESGDLFAEVGV